MDAELRALWRKHEFFLTNLVPFHAARKEAVRAIAAAEQAPRDAM